MSTIWNISPSFIQAFEIVHSVKKMSQEEMFKRLSLMMGGDGTSITKKQLDNYIKEAEKGDVTVSKSGMGALKSMQQNWDTISGGKDSITFADMKDYPTLLTMAFAGSFTMSVTPDNSSSDSSETSDEADSLKDKTTKSLNENSVVDGETPVTDLTSMLNNLLGGTTDTNDESNADLIGTLTNMIAASFSTSTVSVEA